MQFLTKSKDQLMQESKNYLTLKTPLRNFKPGSVIRSILETVNGHIADQYNVMTANLLQTYITTAVGDAIDNIGALFGIVRNQATTAVDTSHSNFRFYIDNLTGYTGGSLAAAQYAANVAAGVTSSYVTATTFVIPAGTTVYSGDISYRTTEDAIFMGATNEVYVPIVATGIGPSYNVSAYGLNKFDLGSEFSIISKYMYCENIHDISSGNFTESDAALRYRIVTAHLSSAKANATAVRLAALSVPGVINVITKEYAVGIGTFLLYVVAESPIPNAGLLQAVQQAVESTKAFGIKAVISYPDYRGFEGTFSLRFSMQTGADEKSLIQVQAKYVIEAYINNLGFGGEFVANELIQRVMDISDKIVDMSVISFGIGDYNPITGINEDFTPIIFMNQTVSSDEYCLCVPGGIIVC